MDLKLKFSSSPRGSGLHQIEVHISGLLDARNEKERHLLLERVRTVLESHGPEIVDHIENLAFQEERAMED